MSFKLKKFRAAAAALFVSAALIPSNINTVTVPVSAAPSIGSNTVEYLDRGITAINTGNGMLVSWRFLANDSDNAEFRLYRNNKLIYTSKTSEATSFLDLEGNSNSSYKVITIENGNTISSDNCSMISNETYFEVSLDIPTAGADYTYSANDCSVGDVDGDGQYEIFVKWDPSNSKDNSQSGITGNVYIDCYRLNGKKLWRIDLGKNIRAGAHYTQFLVADFDCDGKAEMTCKTADGTIDGIGKVIGDKTKDYRNDAGYILEGPEYYTLFDGATGAALDTVDYEYPRGEVSKKTWGDDYGNRCDRFLGAVVYCDGVHPSAVSIRGYYTRMTAVAYDVINKKLVKRWGFNTGYDSSAPGYADGNHNCMPADLDNDGKQELVIGAVCLDDDGSVLWCTDQGHGDAMHVSDLLPDHPGQEVWLCHEHEPYGVSLLDGKTGEIIFHYDHSKDTGRCTAGNILASNPGSEFWGANAAAVYDGNGNTISTKRPAQNFLIYWDGDLERELLDGTTITKMTDANTIETLFTADSCVSNNTTKANPCISADIFGDWREEVIFATADSRHLRIYTTPNTTDYRITTLMHDTQYRMQVAAQQTGYNQPPHTSFYLGSDEKLPERPVVKLNSNGLKEKGAFINTNTKYCLKNKNSGQYMEIESNPQNGTNVIQKNGKMINPQALWKFEDAGDGYYYIYSAFDNNPKYLLDVDYGKTENGANIGIFENTNADAQLFKLLDNDDGSFLIVTKCTSYKSCIEIKNGITEENANVQQWERNGHDCQSWILEPVNYVGSANDVIVGDVNHDGKVNVFDLIITKRNLNTNRFTGFERQFADTNSDGFINVDDIKEMNNFMVKKSKFTAVNDKSSLYYANEMTFSKGVKEDTNKGFKNNGYLNLDNCIGSFVEWNIYVPESGNYICNFNIANGSPVNRSMRIEINGKTNNIIQNFETTGDWTTWINHQVTLTLDKGNNIIRMTSETETGGSNIDYLYFKKANN